MFFIVSFFSKQVLLEIFRSFIFQYVKSNILKLEKKEIDILVIFMRYHSPREAFIAWLSYNEQWKKKNRWISLMQNFDTCPRRVKIFSRLGGKLVYFNLLATAQSNFIPINFAPGNKCASSSPKKSRYFCASIA